MTCLVPMPCAMQCAISCAMPYANALCQCRVPCVCQAKLIAGLRANSQKSRANKLLRNADGAGFSAAAAAAAMGQAAAPDGRSALIGALRSMTAAAAEINAEISASEKPAATAATSTTASAYTAEVATMAHSAAVAALAAPAAVAGFTARTARIEPVVPAAPDDGPKGDRSQEAGAPRKKVPSLIVPALKLTKGQASRRAMRPGRED